MFKYLLLIVGILLLAGAAGYSDAHPEASLHEWFWTAIFGLALFALGVYKARSESEELGQGRVTDPAAVE